MSKSNTQRKGLFSQTLALAQSIGQSSLQLLQHKAPHVLAPLTDSPQARQVVEGHAQRIHPLQAQSAYAHPQAFMQQQLPQLSQQLLGKHYQRIQHVSSFIAPELNEKIAAYVFEQLNHAVSQLSSSTALLQEVGAKNLAELAQDPARSGRISQALANQNKTYAAVIGAVTGVSGVVGAALDIPSSIALALRSIYQTGRAYGFELLDEDQAVVEYIFKHIDLGSILEKQTLLAALRALSSTLQTHDIQQLQKILGSENDVELLKRWLSNDDGELKWQWLKQLPQLAQLSKVLGLLNMGVGAIYSLKLLEQATSQAQLVFAQARDFINQHPEFAEHGPLYAYEQAVQQSAAATSVPSLIADQATVVTSVPSAQELIDQERGEAQERMDQSIVDQSIVDQSQLPDLTETAVMDEQTEHVVARLATAPDAIAEHEIAPAVASSSASTKKSSATSTPRRRQGSSARVSKRAKQS
ncbi:EcsC family protein [Acinetobacter larvae]|uniref:EcsC family protein n=1 Tax=Acinetobacter larvae TaxID=1789224 RepID=A0A1B2LWQ2_9GAMM|nr:EcsC family protein [Acinetobacter larvae]AOA57365.1 hypothetical protein BFG52_02655 [Acinetobacter larvae]